MAGVYYRGSKTVSLVDNAPKTQLILLEPEPSNKHDPNAIKVRMCRSIDCQLFIGYVKKTYSKAFYAEMITNRNNFTNDNTYFGLLSNNLGEVSVNIVGRITNKSEFLKFYFKNKEKFDDKIDKFICQEYLNRITKEYR